MKLTILNNILSNFPINQYFFRQNELDHRNSVVKNIFKVWNIELEFVDKEDILSFENTIYPICNLNNINPNNFDVFTDELKSLIDRGLKVFIFHLNECFFYDEFEQFVKYVLDKNIKENNIYFFVNNDRINDYKEKLNSNINFYFPFFQSIEHSALLQKNKVEFDLTDKKFLYMCHNNKMWHHRLSTLISLKENNLLGDVDFSCVNFSVLRENNLHELKIIYGDDYEQYKSSYDYFWKLGTTLSFYEGYFNPSNIDSPTIETKTFNNSYVNIVTETDYHMDVIHITEKSLKPFYYYQFPIFVAPYGHVNRLKNLYNFDLFDDIIDHSYDDIQDNVIRFKKIFEEIKKLKNKNIKELYKSNKNRFINNNKLVCNITNKTDDQQYIKEKVLWNTFLI